MCSEGSSHNFLNNMKLLRLALLIPPSTSGVERGFSVMNLLVLPLCKSLNENNIDQFMHICLDGPKFLSEEQLVKIIDICKDNAPCRISLQCFLLRFFIDLFFEPCCLTYLEDFVDVLLIYIDYFGSKYIFVMSLSVIKCKSIVMK